MQLSISWFRRQQTRKLTYAIKDWEGPLMAALSQYPDAVYTIDNRKGSFIVKLDITGTENELRAMRSVVEPVIKKVVKDNYLVTINRD